MSGFSYDNAPEPVGRFVTDLTSDLVVRFPEVRAVILYGSLAMGGFHPPKSDIDLMILVDDLSEARRVAMFQTLGRWHARRPYFGGLEASVMRAADAAAPVRPTPFLVQFSEGAAPPVPRPGGAPLLDEELAAGLFVARHRGISLFGPPPRAVIGEVSADDYLAAVEADIDWILEGDNILSTPFYAVLNLCRWTMLRQDGVQRAISKEEGGEWALTHLPNALLPTVRAALAAYRSAHPVASVEERRQAGLGWPPEPLLSFRDAMRITRNGFSTVPALSLGPK